MPHLFMLLLVVFPLVISGCSESKASATQTVECEMVKTEPVWQVDTVCGLDKQGSQMVSVGWFPAVKNLAGTEVQSSRTGCVSIERYCVIKQ